MTYFFDFSIIPAKSIAEDKINYLTKYHLVKRHTIIEINRFTNFLREGAFVRHGIWSLLYNGTSKESKTTSRSIKTDFLTSKISRNHYTNQWDMNSVEFEKVLDLELQNSLDDREKIIIDWNSIEKTPFEKAYELGQQAISVGQIKKFVPIARQTGQMRSSLSQSQKVGFLKKLARLHVSLYPYGEWNGSAGFMGASPEVFFDLNQLELTTMALAGTSGKEIDPDQFLKDPKERKEHQFVIDDIAEQLGALGVVTVDDTEVVQFPTLNHLQTKISARLFNQVSADELIKKLHPTPALGIYPRSKYFKEFSQFPNQSERDFFGAPWGFETSARTFLLVAIRKWDWSGKDVQIFAGCGVVQESIFEKEFAEILKKIDSVKRLFFQD